MSRSSHKEDFFQTTASIEESGRRAAKAKNEHGKPIRLQSKILAVAEDPYSAGSVYVAESAGSVRKVALETGETLALYRGPTAPLTSIAFSPDGKLLFAGCWDKTVWSWGLQSKQSGQKYDGHSDFVKAVTCARINDGRHVLISGGADSKIIIFDIANGEKLHVFKDHSMGIQDLRIDPITLQEGSLSIDLFSAGSDREIRQFSILSSGNATASAANPLIAHETSVYKLHFDEDGDLWTASADKYAKCLTRDSGWQPNLALEHPDFVRDVVVYEQGGWVVTACRDEEIRVWNKATGELYHTYTGHFEEVTGLVLVGNTVVSVSIDATVRQWSLHPSELQKAKEEALNKKNTAEEPPKQESMLTEEEERELAELMGEDE
ncbi:WD40-repeat-containing domain protein [Talaromyces proteolyticus]|uniref:WD40-repeat-containing domain protein n=1 Tax=Talaromyces proteolyticus TaxID=1131652 RepID=A0AAD4L0K0_9EURO|nr:WD40-repeat-containing domain protein [Talaromyces proteolyticus]KAH8704024.1 WD40-repeat-containing domain protein [Talaromyces proteolyticus]